jgi:hypothetical protein
LTEKNKRVPQVLAYFDVLKYSSQLTNKLNQKCLLSSGDPMEVEIRTQSIHAVELLRSALQKRMTKEDNETAYPTPLNSIVIDFYLWNFRQTHRDAIEKAVPFHRTRSINY